MQLATRLFNRIARSHMYWGRKPLVGLLQVFEEINGGVVLDPFCGAGTPTVAALLRGARVVATDLNPMSAFMTHVLTRPLSIPGLQAAFDHVFAEVSPKAELAYRLTCPRCGKTATADFILWKGPLQDGIPIAAKVECGNCQWSALHPLSIQEKKYQCRASQVKPHSWYPDNTIHTVSRRPPVPAHNQLFTGRNLSILAEVFATIDRLESPTYKKALQYVFTASLYSCSQMQMFSEAQPTSSRGWTALRFYIPPLRKETNVIHAFARRFETFLSCKKELNAVLPATRVTQNPRVFMDRAAEVFVGKMDWSESLKVFGPVATHVFLDPPYNVDIDYFGFSEFWGAWLRMPFDFKAEWHARKVKGERTEDLLNLTARSTPHDCRVTLVLDPKGISPSSWGTEPAIASSGYRVESTGYFLYNNSYKRGKDLLRRRDRYFILSRSQSSAHPAVKPATCAHNNEESTEATYPYLRVMDFLYEIAPNVEVLRTRTKNELLPRHLRHLCDQLTEKDVSKAWHGSCRNPRTYHSLCLTLINILLQTDDWQFISASNKQVEHGAFDLPKPVRSHISGSSKAIAMFTSRDGANRLHVFFYDQDRKVLRDTAEKIRRQDSGQYRQIALLVFPSRSMMEDWRAVSSANKWPRGFFMSFDELRTRCAEANPEKYLMLCAPIKNTTNTNTHRTKIATFTAEVKSNIQVGGSDAPYYKLQFKASGLTGIVPGQFIMLDTIERKPPEGIKSVPWREFTKSYATAPQTYLKRPFGIHRAFYPHFVERDYLSRMKLPRSLAAVMHTVLPDTFDVFYKVLPSGKGTREMRNLSPGKRVEMIGPLGQGFKIREMVNKGVDEVHVIGGGVGMAPLIFLVQALRYFGILVKAFIGIETIELLKYSERPRPARVQVDHIEEGFAAGVRDVHIYVDDLTNAGVNRDDIFVACDRASDIGQIVPQSNYMNGFISELYKQYLSQHPRQERRVAFACGPTPMMKAVYDLTKAHSVHLYVLIEKRMSCGIGVCLSCVCRTTSVPSGYSRVCKEGPVFDATEIVWP